MSELTTPAIAPVPARRRMRGPRRNGALERAVAVVGRRSRFVVLQLMGAILVTFFLVRLIPGDPAVVMAGGSATPETVASIREHLKLDDPLPTQLLAYVTNLAQGDLGDSLSTGKPVLTDLVDRLPATLELISFALLISIAVAVPLGMIAARRRSRIARKGIVGYSLFAGALPDFWLGLILIYTFSYGLGIMPSPIGRLGFDAPPPEVTGLYTVDSLLALQFATFWSAVMHLVLPVATLVLVYSGQIIKVARASVADADKAGFVDLYDGAGVAPKLQRRRSMRLALPPVVTICGITYGFLLGGAVLVEQVFSWGGVGQYAVQAVKSVDHAAIQGFVLLAAIFNIIVYLVVDVIFVLVDPRFARRR